MRHERAGIRLRIVWCYLIGLVTAIAVVAFYLGYTTVAKMTVPVLILLILWRVLAEELRKARLDRDHIDACAFAAQQPDPVDGTVKFEADGSVSFLGENGNVYPIDPEQADEIRALVSTAFAEGLCPNGCGPMLCENNMCTLYCPKCGSKIERPYSVASVHNN